MSKIEVIVQLKPEVLDPEGRAIKKSIARLGVNDLADVSVRKSFLLEIEGDIDHGRAVAKKIAEEYLCNPAAECYEIRDVE